MKSVAMAPSHMQNNASQAAPAKTDPPVTPAPMAQPPANIAPKPISTAPNIDRRMVAASLNPSNLNSPITIALVNEPSTTPGTNPTENCITSLRSRKNINVWADGPENVTLSTVTGS